MGESIIFEKNALGHEKRFNKKKLTNLFNYAIANGLSEVTIYNYKKKTERTITVYELEQYLNGQENKQQRKHPLSSKKDVDIIPWYKENVELELVYKNQFDEKSTTIGHYSPATDKKLHLTGSPVEEGIVYADIPYNVVVSDEQQKEHTLQYMLHVQKFPANMVFTNTEDIDVYAYNITYMYVGERKHNTTSNSDIVKFIRKNKEENNTLYLTGDDEETAKQAAEQAAENGLTVQNDTVALSYITINETPLTLVNETQGKDDETWYFENAPIKIKPKFSSYEGMPNSEHGVDLPHVKFGLTGSLINNVEEGQFIITINPYSLAWKNDDKYAYCITYGNYLTDSVTVNVHPIHANIYDMEGYDDYVSLEYTDSTGSTGSEIWLETEVETIYSTDSVNIDLSKYIKYVYDIDNGEKKICDLTNSKTKANYTHILNNGQIVNLPTLTTTYKINETDKEKESSCSIINVKLDKKVVDNFNIKTRSSLVNPIDLTKCSDSKNILNHINIRSNPELKTLSSNSKIVQSLSASIAEQVVTVSGKLTYYLKITNAGYLEDNNENTYSLKDTKKGNSLVLNSIIYSFPIKDAGFVQESSETTNYKTYEYIGGLTSVDNEQSTIPIDVRYWYTYNDDKTKITRPQAVVANPPLYNVTYIGDKAVVCIISDDFDITTETEYMPFNNLSTEHKLDVVKNSYILCELRMNETSEIGTGSISISYQHKADFESGTEPEFSTLEINLSNNYTVSNVIDNLEDYEYRVGDEYAYTYWEIGTDTYNAYNEVNPTEHAVNSDITKFSLIKLHNEDKFHDDPSLTKVSIRIADKYIFQNTTVIIDSFVNSIIPTKIFSALYNKIGTESMTSGFMKLESPVRLGTDGDIYYGKYKLTPKFNDAHSSDIQLETIGDVFTKIKDFVETPIDVWTMYYLCTRSEEETDNEYYLYCVITTPSNDESTAENCTQILPPFVCHLNMYKIEHEDNSDIHTNYIGVADYETFLNSDRNIVTKEIIYPFTDYTTYMLYGFDSNVLNKIEVDTTTKTGIKSIYDKNAVPLIPKSWLLEDAENNTTYCRLDFEYWTNNDGKLTDFDKLLSRETYTYINEYIDKLDYSLNEEEGKHLYNVSDTTNKVIEFETNDISVPYESKTTTINKLFAYVTIGFKDSEDPENPKDFSYCFRITPNNSNVACYFDTDDDKFKFSPIVISDYEEMHKPDGAYPKYGVYTPKYKSN